VVVAQVLAVRGDGVAAAVRGEDTDGDQVVEDATQRPRVGTGATGELRGGGDPVRDQVDQVKRRRHPQRHRRHQAGHQAQRARGGLHGWNGHGAPGDVVDQ
jgi:hypothetical protein